MPLSSQKVGLGLHRKGPVPSRERVLAQGLRARYVTRARCNVAPAQSFYVTFQVRL